MADAKYFNWKQRLQTIFNLHGKSILLKFVHFIILYAWSILQKENAR